VTNIPGLDGENIRALERATIRKFVGDRRHLLRGHVLDFGCGSSDTCREPSPYRDLVEAAGGVYFGYDPALGHSVDQWLKGPYNAILCTQVIQSIKRPWEVLYRLRQAVKVGAHLVMTYPTAWPEIETEDEYWRFTAKGMAVILEAAGWNVIEDVGRGKIDIPGWPLYLGHGVVARCEE
jgi:Methyltransferase domain